MDKDEMMLLLGEIRGDQKAILKNQTKQDERIEVIEGDIAEMKLSKAKVLGGVAVLSTLISGLMGFIGWKHE